MLLLISVASAASMNDGEFIDFLNAYPAMSPAQVADDIAKMTAHQLTILAERSALGASIYARACHSDQADLVFRTTDGPVTCSDLLSIQEKDIQWGMAMGAVRYAETQRIQVVTAMSCALGWLEGTQCQSLAHD
jgi:hypothetical protein